MLQDIIEMQFNQYEPGFWFIDTISPGYPKTVGTFVIPPKQYLVSDSRALSGANSIILITQVMIITLLDNLVNKRFPGLEDVEVRSIAEVEKISPCMVVRSYKQVVFKRPIMKDEPDKSFECNFKKIRTNSTRDFIYLDFDYSLSGGKCTGQWTAAYAKNKR